MGIHGDTMYAFCGFVMQDHVEEEVPQRLLEERLHKGGTLGLLTVDEDQFEWATDQNTVHALDLGTRRWRKLNPTGTPPFPCDKLSSVDYKGKTYLFGGYGPDPEPNLR